LELAEQLNMTVRIYGLFLKKEEEERRKKLVSPTPTAS